MRATPPLLMYAEGRKPRARKAVAPRPREISLHCQVARTLRQHCLPDWLWFHIPNQGRRTGKSGAILKHMGLRPGVPDFQLISPRLLPHFMELKRVGEELSDEQRNFRIWCVTHGIPYAVAYDLTQVLVAFDRWGCLRVKVG